MARFLLDLLCFLLDLLGCLVGLIAAWGLTLFVWGPAIALSEGLPGFGPTAFFLVTMVPLMLLGYVGTHVIAVVPIYVKWPRTAERAYPLQRWIYRNCAKRSAQVNAERMGSDQQ